MYILLSIIGILVLLIAVCLIRAALLKPNQAIHAKIAKSESSRSEEYGKRLAEMLACETITKKDEVDKTRFYKFHDIMEKLYPNIHQHCEKYDFDGSLLFKWSGKSSEKPILLMSHHDVVEATGKWQHEPFSGDIEDGVVWGRGAVDTKGSLMCLMQAVEELIESGYQPDYDVYMASSCTEEHSGPGAQLTVDYLKSQGVQLYMVMDEGGMIIEKPIPGVEGTYGMVGVLEKASGGLKFTAKGAGGHASTPTKNTPLARLGKFMTDVDEHNPFKVEFNDTVLEMFRRLTPNMNFKMKVVFSNMWLFKPILKIVMPAISAQGAAMLQTTIAFTTAQGSQGLNVLPHEAYVTANLRYIHHQPPEASIARISEIAKKYDITTEVVLDNKLSPITDYRQKPFQLVEQAMNDIYPGVAVSPYILTAGTDAKIYTQICDNVIRFAPLHITNQQLKSIHTVNENINSDSLPHAVDFYKYIIKHVKD